LFCFFSFTEKKKKDQISMPSQEDWILGAARLFPSPTPDHIRTSDIPLVLICLDIDDEDLLIRRALGVGRVREIPVANLVRVLSPILPAENSASERYTMFKTFDKYGNGVVNVRDLQRVAVGAGLLTSKECERIMSTLANTGNGMTFDHWCYVLKDETGEEEAIAKSAKASPTGSGGVPSLGAVASLNGSTKMDNNSGGNSPRAVRSRGSSRIGGSPAVHNISPQTTSPTSRQGRADSTFVKNNVPPMKPLDEKESVPPGM
jgi:Ca2+-binding EF-hand superfamily protein